MLKRIYLWDLYNKKIYEQNNEHPLPIRPKRNQKELELISFNAKRRMLNCKLALNGSQKFFGYFLSSLTFIEDLGLKYKTMATDGMNIYYDPEFVMDHTPNEIKWVICHEIMHCVLKHFLRKQANPAYWNAAGDYALNYLITDLPKECGEPLPDGLGGTKDETKAPDGRFVKDIVAGWNAESTYQFLLQNNIQLPPEEKWNFGEVEAPRPPGEEQESNAGDDGQGTESTSPTGTIEGGAARIKIVKERPKTAEELSRDWDEKLRKALEVGKTQLGDKFYRKILALSQGQIDWKNKLKFYINTIGKKSSWSVPDRRFLGVSGMDPQFKRNTTFSAFDDMIIICDTSGSIGDTELVLFASETLNIIKEFNVKRVRLIWCDSVLHLPVEIINPRNPGQIKKLTEARGGGGTSFIPPFEWIGQNIKDFSKLGPIIYFTDLQGSFPDPKEFNIPRYKNKVIWCAVTSLGSEQIDVPFGRVLDIKV